MKKKISLIKLCKLILFYCLSVPLSLLLPKNKNTVILGSNSGQAMSGNSKYLFEHWSKNGKFKVFFVLSEKADYKKYKEQYSNVLFAFSLHSLWTMSLARFFILTHGRIDIPCCGLGKIIIQTWHSSAGPKKIGLLNNTNQKLRIKNWLYKVFDYNRITYFLSSSSYVSLLFSGIFGQPISKFVETGFPRNDVFIQKEDNGRARFAKYTTSQDNEKSKYILYTPTYKPYPSSFFNFPDAIESIPELNELLESHDSYILLRGHRNALASLPVQLADMQRLIDLSPIVLNDLHEIQPYVDLVISDYSSVHVDSLLVDTPAIFTIADFEKYSDCCGGFNCDFDLFSPGAKVASMQELIAEMKTILEGEDKYKEARAFLRRLCFSSPEQAATKKLEQLLDSKA